MILRKTNQHNKDLCRIILVRQAEDLAGLKIDPATIKQSEELFAKDKKQLSFTGPGSCLIIQKLESKSGDSHDAPEAARKAAHTALALLDEHALEKVTLVNGSVSPEEGLAYAEGLALSAYEFLKYKTREKAKKQHFLEEIHVLDEAVDEARLAELENLVQAVFLSRNLVNEPLSFLTAPRLSREIELMGKEAGFEVEILNKSKIEALKMGGLLAVNKGSIDPPTFTILSHKPENAINDKPMVLVGKGVVYDTGGLSLKPTQDSMDYMKSDMGGAAAVAGTFYALAKNRLPLWAIGLIPATDNRPDGNAYVPGDVVTMYNGTTVEVLNTDAEGRMILADALSYASQYEPELVIELSTLTGSAQAALDRYGIAGMGTAGKKNMESLQQSGDSVSERIAIFPFWDEYKEALQSDVADLKNIGGRYAGSITAGKFLEHFTDYPYIHLDIAGPAFNKAAFNYRGKGGSGVGVRLLHHFLLERTRANN